MPRWARFLSCSITGLLLLVLGFLLTAYWYERPAHFWQGLQEFLTTAALWPLLGLFTALAAGGLLLGRALVRLFGLGSLLAGLLAGVAVAISCLTFLLAAQVPYWGGWANAWPRIWPAGGYFLLPFGVSGGISTWLWDRLG